jgi:monovalent cation:H+ antiporter-2, CPA2 family
MQSPADFLHTLSAVFCVAAAATLICVRLRLPTVLALIVAGMLLGPFGPSLSFFGSADASVKTFADPAMVAALSELGVVFLMFTIGLELHFSQLKSIGLRGAGVAVTGVGLMLLLSYGAARAGGLTPLVALFLAASVAISSTMIVARALEHTTEPTQRRKSVLGVLVIEDIIAILLLAGLTLLGKSTALDGKDLLLTLGRLSAFLLALIVIGALVVPRTLRATSRRERNDVLLVVVMGFCFAAVLATHSFGYPVALGAFVAGALCAESGQAARIESMTLPLKDLFTAVFFVSAGMAIDPRLLLLHWHWIAALVPLVVIGKSIGVAIGFFFSGQSIRSALHTGMSMGQSGEFGLVIAALGVSAGIGVNFLFPVAAGVAAITMVITPWMVRAAEPVANFVDARLPRRLQNFAALYGSWVERLAQRGSTLPIVRRSFRAVLLDCALLLLIAVLMALFSDDVSRILKARTALARQSALLVVYGLFLLLAVPLVRGLWRGIRTLGVELAKRALPKQNADMPDTAHAPRAAFVLALQVGIWSALSIPMLALLQPFWPNLPLAPALMMIILIAGLSFWRSAGELYSHTQAGSNAVIEAFKQMTQAQQRDRDGPEVKELESLLPGLGEFVGQSIDAGHPWINQSLAALNLRGLTGANVIAILRQDGDVNSPDGKARLQQGDTLIVAGTHEAIRALQAAFEHALRS